MQKPFLSGLLLLLLLAAALPLSAETIAVHPFKGEPVEIADIFFEVLLDTLRNSHGQYRAIPISLDSFTPDVPPGGFPANVCPSASVTAGALYAITGTVSPDVDHHDSFRVSLYLWNMTERRMIFHDEMTAADRETCEYRMPYMLLWLLSWIEWDKSPDDVMVGQHPEAPWVWVERFPSPYARPEAWDSSHWVFIGPKGKGGEDTSALENPDQWVYLGPEQEKWLHLGVRAGMGTSQWLQKQDPDSAVRNHNVTEFYSANIALQASFHVLRFLDIQTEFNFNSDFGVVGYDNGDDIQSDDIAASWSLTVPFLIKLNLRGSHLKAGVFGGVYLYVPLATTNAGSLDGYLDYKPDQPGFTFGMSVGWKLGTGCVFLDARFDYDGNWLTEGNGHVNYRNSVRVNAGYEWGFVSKK
ncbi:MAG: hypothetical protein FWG46_06505 [Treponema sp.]|nr:hypothetical protein [Treponema sp.]